MLKDGTEIFEDGFGTQFLQEIDIDAGKYNFGLNNTNLLFIRNMLDSSANKNLVEDGFSRLYTLELSMSFDEFSDDVFDKKTE